nr:MAG TPA: hypothetical protein [Caudoviricetes sp.]
MDGCKKYYIIDIIIDGNVIRKGKYTKVFTPVSYYWLDYNDHEVINQDEINRLDAAATEDNEVSNIYENYYHFMSSVNVSNTIKSIPMDKHVILVDWSPSGDHEVIGMKYDVGIEGDSYLIYISNVGDKSSTVYLPQMEEGGKNAYDVEYDVTNIHVGGSFVNIATKGTESIRATFRNNTWYWEVMADNQSKESVVTIGSADFLVFRYLWEASAGTDLDTATELLNSGIPNADNLAVGWNCPGNSNSTVTGLMKWGGDNRGSGQECVYISVKDLRDKYLDILPAVTDFMTYATWFASKGTGKASFNLIAYKGGEMSQSGYNFINTGGEEVYNKIHSFDVNTIRGMLDYKNNYTPVTKISYNKDSNSVSMAVGDTVIDNQGQTSELFDRVSALEEYVDSHKVEVQTMKNDISTNANSISDINSMLGDLSSILDEINGEII